MAGIRKFILTAVAASGMYSAEGACALTEPLAVDVGAHVQHQQVEIIYSAYIVGGHAMNCMDVSKPEGYVDMTVTRLELLQARELRQYYTAKTLKSREEWGNKSRTSRHRTINCPKADLIMSEYLLNREKIDANARDLYLEMVRFGRREEQLPYKLKGISQACYQGLEDYETLQILVKECGTYAADKGNP